MSASARITASAPLSVSVPHRDGRRERALRRLGSCALAVALLVLAGGIWLAWDNLRVVVTEVEVPVADLPEQLDGARIAQISDLHGSEAPGLHGRLRDAVAEADPDLIALTGDMLDASTQDIGPTVALLGELGRIAPAYSVLGNHEADSPHRDDLIAALEREGIPTLRDEAREVELRGARMTLIGLDDPRVAHAAGLSAPAPDAVVAQLAVPAGAPVILLAHRPELLAAYERADADVVLSGHAHGGQVRIPFVGGLYAPHQGLWPELTSGVHERAGTRMVISRGLGNSVVSVRVNDPRELVVVTLRRA